MTHALHDALHPLQGVDPEQPPEPLGAAMASSPDATTGTPPMIGRRLSADAWHDYIARYPFPWKLPSRVVLHHTLRPTQHTWAGLASMRSMQRHYAGLGWTSAPHLYVAHDGIWLFTPLSRIGIHAGRGNGSVREGWYSIGVELVWDGDQSRPEGPTWANALAVLEGLRARIGRPLASVLSFHRDYSTKSCPGNTVTRDWVLSEAAGVFTPPETPGYTPQSPITGRPLGTAGAAIRYLSARSTKYDAVAIREIVTAYQRIGDAAGVDWFLALAQVAHETGDLCSWWCARPRRNPAGIGVTGHSVSAQQRAASPAPYPAWAWALGEDGRWHEGLSFPAWAPHAANAHLGRLLAYALPAGRGTEAQQALIATALHVRPLPPALRGICRDGLQGLDGVWNAERTGYPAKVAAKANAMRDA